MKIGCQIKALRQQAEVSQETLAQAMGVSAQAVSRWETGVTAPDISLLPALAGFFGVSIDVLFCYDAADTEQAIQEFLDGYFAALRRSYEEAEALLQEALRRYPGQEILRLLQCRHLQVPRDAEAKLSLCRELSRSKDPTVRTEALMVMASVYHRLGREDRMRDALALLPEVDETKLSLSARFFTGEEAMLSAQRQKNASLALALDMQLRIAELWEASGHSAYAGRSRAAAGALLEALKGDAPYRFPKGDRPDGAWERLAPEFLPRLEG